MLPFVCFRVAKNLIVFWILYKILKYIYNYIIKQVFYYEETELPVINDKGEIWVRATTVASILGYNNTMKSIRDHVDPEDKRRLSELSPKSKGNVETLPLKRTPASRQNEMFTLTKNDKKHNLYQRVWNAV